MGIKWGRGGRAKGLISTGCPAESPLASSDTDTGHRTPGDCFLPLALRPLSAVSGLLVAELNFIIAVLGLFRLFTQHQNGGGSAEHLMTRLVSQMDHSLDSKCIFMYPLCIDGESHNPSGSVNFSKVSHGKFSFDMTGFTGNAQSADVEFYIDVYGVSYNWQQIRDGRALVSFA
eukprot:scaffold11840_cov133-Isochrysis_galbana.AAC.3